MDGGYDTGYRTCACFWGRDPGKLVRLIANVVADWHGKSVLDVGCGEGKNSAFLAACGARVRALDISEEAIRHARSLWAPELKVHWQVASVVDSVFEPQSFDCVIAYGLLHCLREKKEIVATVEKLKSATAVGGHIIIVALNARHQDLRAHPELKPCLLRHDEYVQLLTGLNLLVNDDADLTETHPHNLIPHTHSLTRILAQRMT